VAGGARGLVGGFAPEIGLTKKTPFRIRPVQKSDEPALALVYQACFSSKPYSEKWTLASAQKRVTQILKSGDVRGWVAMVFGQPVAFAFLQVREGFNGPYGEMLETAVHPYFRKQGLGLSLLKVLKAFQKKKKLKVVYTLAYRGMFDKFYQKAGFKPSKRSLIYVWK
jgi:aminoglycoside 6'-N-acetyltransferase I